MIQRVPWTVFIFLLLGPSSCHGFTVASETSLRNSLLTNYSANVRPDMITLVELSFTMLSINFVDLKLEQFSLSGWWSMKWTDSRLNWTGTIYTVPVIQVYQDEIWTPALVVDNSILDLSAVGETSIPMRVRMDGQVTWNPPGILTTSCEMVVTYFPFDTQTCSVAVTSFGYTIQELNISVLDSGIVTTYFSENGEWTLLRTWNERSEFLEDGYDYAKVTMYFHLERRAVYYGLNTMLPVLLNSLLIPLVFLLPHDAGEKIGYCLTVLLAYVVILTIVTDGLPTTAKTQSLLGVYIAVVLMLSGVSVALAIHSLHLYHRSPSKPIPQWQAKLTRCVLKFVGKKCTRVKPNRVEVEVNSDPALPENKKKAIEEERTPTLTGSSERVTPMASGDDSEMTWQKVAQAYDSFLLRLYLLIIIVFSVGFLLAIVANRV